VRTTAAARPAASTRKLETAGASDKVELREEQVRTKKVPVKTGEVKVRKEVVTEHKTLSVPVEREEVVIERRPASGRVTSSELKAGDDIRIPVKKEEVVIEKQPVVKEEVTVGKRTVRETREIPTTVRREEARIEREGNVDVRSSGRNNNR